MRQRSVLSSAVRGPGRLRRRRSCRDADVLDGLDAGRFPQGRRRGPVDRQRRPRLPRPVDLAGRGNRGAVPVDGRRRRRRHAVGRHRQRRQGPEDRRRTARSRRSSTPTSSRSTRSRRRRTAGSTSPRRPTARSITSPRTARRRRSSIPTTSTSGRWPSIATATCSPPPATRASSTRSRPTARARASTRRTRPTSSRSPSPRRASCSPAPNRPGRVFRIDAAGKAFVLLDSPFKEIHALRVADDGTIYAAAVSGASGGDRATIDRSIGARPTRPRAAAPTGVRGDHRRSPSSTRRRRPSQPTPRAGSRRTSSKGAIYRIRPNGLWDTYWETGDDSPFDVADRAGRQPARRHRHRGQDLPPRRRSRAGDAARRAPPRGRSRRSCASRPGRIVGATSNPGQAVRALGDAGARAAPTTPTCATPAPSRAGARSAGARPRAPGQVQVVTRSGNTATPDETWSAWSKPYTIADGEQIASPNARYLQWRAVLTARTAPSPS